MDKEKQDRLVAKIASIVDRLGISAHWVAQDKDGKKELKREGIKKKLVTEEIVTAADHLNSREVRRIEDRYNSTMKDLVLEREKKIREIFKKCDGIMAAKLIYKYGSTEAVVRFFGAELLNETEVREIFPNQKYLPTSKLKVLLREGREGKKKIAKVSDADADAIHEKILG